MAECMVCHISSKFISKNLGVCLKCIRDKPERALEMSARVHQKSRAVFGLPEKPPNDADGISCGICINACKMGEGSCGYCGLRKNEKGKLTGGKKQYAKLSWYHDPLPTNCVGDWVCPGGTGAGYPKYAYCRGAESGYLNLAVFFHACSFNCLFCQNWHFREQTFKAQTVSVQSLASAVNEKTACICYFGGDPTPQLPFSLKVSELAVKKNPDRILRVCWETNGSMNPRLLDQMMEIALNSGGCVKFDLKAWDESLHRVLTGFSNQRTQNNFKRAAEKIHLRPIPPPLVASTLLVPGYIDAEEIYKISKYIASLNPDIPYSLLAFHPQFLMSDMALTPKALADDCLKSAKDAGLKRVRLGNAHLLI